MTIQLPDRVPTVQEQLDQAIDGALDALQRASDEGVEIDPLQTILARLKERGDEINLDDAPPMMRMLLSGMIG